MPTRSMYIWQVPPILAAEGGATRVIDKARRASISALWIKIADGRSVFSNLNATNRPATEDLINRAKARGIEVWGWHVPRCATVAIAQTEANLVRQLAQQLNLDGLIMDAEGGAGFFQGGTAEASAYAAAMRAAKADLGKPLAISSHDIPSGIGNNWLQKFDIMAAVSDFNFPQVYYGGSPSVANRLGRAEADNSHLPIPFVPVGAAWIGQGDGGCSSASACAERAREFIRLCNAHGHPGYSFWHWLGAPAAFWEVLNTTRP